MTDVRPDVRAKYLQQAAEQWEWFAQERAREAQTHLSDPEGVLPGLGMLLDVLRDLERVVENWNFVASSWEQYDPDGEERDYAENRRDECDRKLKSESERFADIVKDWAPVNELPSEYKRIYAYECERRADDKPILKLCEWFNDDPVLSKSETWGDVDLEWLNPATD
jgi:hypothetical protein